MGKIAEMIIEELENDLAANRAADQRVKIWEMIFANASPYERKKMLVLALEELAGFSKEEIDKMFAHPIDKE